MTSVMDIIGAGYQMAGRGYDWKNNMLRDLYTAALSAVPDDVEDKTFALVANWIVSHARPPDTAELMEVLRPIITPYEAAPTVRRGCSIAEARRAFEEGFLEDRAATGIPVLMEWQQVFDKWRGSDYEEGISVMQLLRMVM